jgi:inner membrane protein
MDSISQFVLGASVAETFLGKRLGNKALLWGGLIGTLPDLDVVPGYWMSDLSKIEFHRGPSHSILFYALISFPIAYSILKIHKPQNLNVKICTIGVFLILFTHSLLDLCTTWGTKILWPFTDTAYSLKIIFVVDPIYTLPFIFSLFIILWLTRQNSWRKKLNILALILSTFYLCWCGYAKSIIKKDFQHIISNFEKPVIKFNSRPSPMNSFLWAVTIETKSAFYCYYHSIFDNDISQPTIFYKNQKVRNEWKEREDFQKLIKITGDQILILNTDNERKGIEVADLRFGQISGWDDRNSPFVFRYFLEGAPSDIPVNYTLPRPKAEFKSSLGALWNRIWGKEL